MLKMIATIGVIQVVAIVMNVIRSKVLAVLLGPVGVGVVSVIDQTVQLVAYISAFSLPFAAVKFLSLSHSQGPAAFARTYGLFVRMLLILTTIGTAISLVIVWVQPHSLGSELDNYRAFLLPALLAVPGMALQGFFSSVLAAAQKARTSAVMSVIVAFVLTGAAYLGIRFAGIAGFYWCNVFAGLLVVVVMLVYLSRKLDMPLFGRPQGLGAEFRAHPRVITFAFILFSTSVTYSLSYFMARYTVLTGFGPAEAGLLQAAIALAASLNLVLNPANGLYLTPILNRDVPHADKMHVASEFQSKLMLVISMIAMPMVLFPQWLITLFYSSSFLTVSFAVPVFVVAQCMVQLAGVYQALLIGVDDLKFYGLIVSTTQILLGVLAWVLAPYYGILGVGIACLISSTATFFLTLARLGHKYGFRVSPRLWLSMSYGLLALLLSGAIMNHYDTWALPVIVSKLALYLLFLFSLLVFLSREERQELFRRVEQSLAYIRFRGDTDPMPRLPQ